MCGCKSATAINYQLAISNENKVLNKWTTANEINVSYFNVTKSTDGINFKVIGKVRAENGTLNNYTFIDELTTRYQLLFTTEL